MAKLNPAIKTNDFIDKGQKIVAALYLVSNHLSDNDPLKRELRTVALSLHNEQSQLHTAVQRLVNLLKTASIAKVIHEQNVAILLKELTLFVHLYGDHHTVSDLFSAPFSYQLKTEKTQYKTNFINDSETEKPQLALKNDTKNKRQEQILSFINVRKSAVIKDISAQFPEVSEKTIQRELSALVDTGKITKRGSKRWSMYMAI